MPTWSLNGKTPYEIQHGRKPNLSGIQEFGATAYVKDLSAGKLDLRACIGRFIGYDLESKGYRIYWPKKKTILVEHDVVFNKNDVTSDDNSITIPGDALAEGERDKIIQSPNLAPLSVKLVDELELDHKPEAMEKPEKVLFLSESSMTEEQAPELSPVTYCAERLRDQLAQWPGFYKDQRVKTAYLEAHATNHFVEEEDDDKIVLSSKELTSLNNKDTPPKFDAFTIFDALGSSIGSKPKMLDEAFNGPKGNKWKAAYAFELSQLESMGVWEIIDLPKGETAIPYQTMYK